MLIDPLILTHSRVPAVSGAIIDDKNGALVDSVRVDGAPYDFQIQANGLLSYALGDFAANVPLPGEELQHMVQKNVGQRLQLLI